jgi:predicted MFS family arabinose efflux permease
LGVIGLVWFLIAESRIGDEALIPLRLFKDKTFSLVTVINVITGIGMFGGLAVLPLYLQIVGGASPTEAGLQLLPMTFGIMGGSVFSGQTISRIGRYKSFPVAGSIIMTLSLAWMTAITTDTSYGLIAIMSFFFGFGLGNLMQPTILAIQNAVTPRDIGVATSSATLFRQIGATLGTAIFLSLLFGRLGENVGSRFNAAVGTAEYQTALMDPANAETAQKLASLQNAGASAFDDTSWLSTANQVLVRPILDGFTDSSVLVFGVGAVITAVSIIFTVILPNNELRQHDMPSAPVEL